MRKYKFRVWDKYYNKIDYEPCYVAGDLEVTVINDYFNEEISDGNIIMQYIGLNDVNNKEIYEGDIVKGFTNGVYDGKRINNTFVVGYYQSSASFGFIPVKDFSNGCDFGKGYPIINCEVEVIGNVYDNGCWRCSSYGK